MKQTVVGVFDLYATAQHAALQLRESGIAHSVYVTENIEAGSAPSATGAAPSATRDDDRGVVAHIRSFFAELFGSEREDERELGRYAEAVRRGGAVVRVEVDKEADAEAARNALQAAGAIDIEKKANEWRASGWTEETSSTPDVSSATSGEEDVIPVVQEEVRVGKRVVDTGGVRVYTRTVETPVHESVELRSERAEVERRPVDRPATAADLDALGERTIEVRETSEQAVVAKEARVVEEVVVGKTLETRTEQIDESVRRTEVEVEGIGGAGDETAGWRSHWQSSFAGQGGSFEEYEPHYRWGYSMRTDPRYANRRWEEIEPTLRSDWESRHTGSAWDRFKVAVRRGWERMTS